MPDRPYSRRNFLLRLGLAGAAVPLIGACGGDVPQPPAGSAAAGPAPPADPDPTAATCPGYDELTEEQLAARERLRYTDRSTTEGQCCRNCLLVVDEERFGSCRGCRALPGPVASQGWCSAWVAKS